MAQLEGKTVVITGASSGIGAAISAQCLDAGAQVIGLCRRSDTLDSRVRGISCDLRDQASIDDAMAQIESASARVDVWVNNAGVAKLSKITDGALEDWDTMWSVNVRALAYCSQAALKFLSPESGQIINVSSMSGHRVPPTGGFYAPTKFAVRGITDALRSELRAAGSRIRVASVSPGFVDTPLLDEYFQGREEQLAEAKASMQMLGAEDVANCVLHIINSPMHVDIGDIQLRSSDQKA
ncbi:SDR family oxidoreductase [Rubritalea tangerina]|uniref:SDR family oxidoreductase n=2 Tax=Rubritalea tangerina TaxID=430798 RepID=A0ABW4Z6E8_9BACT